MTDGRPLLRFSVKIQRQMQNRGWTPELAQRVYERPARLGRAVNRANQQAATAFFLPDASYLIVEDATGDVVQISNRNDPLWMPDASIVLVE